MRFRLGLTIGFGVGYYLGAKAGRERYHQLDDLLQKAKGNESVGAAAEKARAAAEIGAEKAKDLVAKVRGESPSTEVEVDLDLTDPPVPAADVTTPLVDAPVNGESGVNPGNPAG